MLRVPTLQLARWEGGCGELLAAKSRTEQWADKVVQRQHSLALVH